MAHPHQPFSHAPQGQSWPPYVLDSSANWSQYEYAQAGGYGGIGEAANNAVLSFGAGHPLALAPPPATAHSSSAHHQLHPGDFYFPPSAPPPPPPQPQYQPSYFQHQPYLHSVDHGDYYTHLSPSHSAHNDFSPINDAPLDSVTFPQGQHYSLSPVKPHFDPPFMPSKPEKGFFTTSHHHSRSLDKENFPTPILPSDLPHKPDPYHFQTRPILGKRHAPDLLSSASKSYTNKRIRLESEDALFSRDHDPVPAPEDMPPMVDELPGRKPPYSYAELIANAILRAPGRRLTLNGIYTWIQNTFSFYKDSESAWTNSIRHNLSLNKAFSKRDRPKDDPGKGSYWVVEDGMERQFLSNKRTRRPGQDSFTSSDAPRPSSRAGPPSQAIRPPSRSEHPVQSDLAVNKHENDYQEHRSTHDQDVSSDATLPASEALPLDQLPDPAALTQSSPLPPDLRSSPPVAARRLDGSPHLPQARRDKKGTESFRDSGFYSSIESSVPRVAANPLHLTSDADRRNHNHKHSRKRSSRGGRAEDEIARMRGSSFDPSPTKAKTVFKQPLKPASALPSSPLRPRNQSAREPLTPGVKLKPSSKLQSTVSPNTHLRRHRQEVQSLIGTPAVINLVQDELKFSPAFKLGSADIAGMSPFKFDQTNPSPAKIMTTDLLDEFDVFNRKPSPVKRLGPNSALGRPGLTRAMTSGDVDAVSRPDFRLGSPIRMPPPHEKSPPSLESPTKRPKAGSPSHLDAFDSNQFWGSNSSSDIDEDEGLDLTKGFSSIGASLQKPSALVPSGKENVGTAGSKPRPPSKSSKPPLGRASTNIF